MEPFSKHHSAPAWTGYLFAVAVCAVATAAALPFRDSVHHENAAMLYLAGIALAAAYRGRASAMLAAFLSVATYNFFFTHPYYSFRIYDYRDVIATVLLLITSVLIGSLAARLKSQSDFYQQKEQVTATFYAMTRELASTRGSEAMADIACRHVQEAFGCMVTVLLPDGESNLIGYRGKINVHNAREEAVSRWCFEHKEASGLGTPTMPGSSRLYLPLVTGDACVGVLGLKPDKQQERFATEEIELLNTFAGLIASALQRANASQVAEQARVEAEAEKLRNTLLSSVSHDLRTPLASVRGSIEAVLESSKSALSGEAVELLEAAHSQSEKLTRMVNDLLDINRLETGAPLLNRQPYYINEIIGAAMSRVKPWLGGRSIKTEIEPRLPLLIVDGALIEQVLVNLLENAIKYTPDNGTIWIAAQRKPNHLFLSISDNGCGISKGAEQKIFEKFYRANNNPAIQGSGLGLAICKAIVGAHSGLIWAANNEKGGTAIMLTLPLNSILISEEAEAAHG